MKAAHQDERIDYRHKNDPIALRSDPEAEFAL
jgi:hypothetical protein